jgi:hypothetical protein
MQTDARWGNVDYSVNGEKTTIKASGCGPTCAAMLIETLTGKTFTPKDACAWSLKHGYKAYKQGTYYSYFVPQFKEFGLKCERMNTASLYGYSQSLIHDKAFKLLKDGWYLIACMGKGTWTSSGHYIVVWWEDGKVRINDPASTKDVRLNGDLATFKKQVKYYWAIDAREYNKNGKALPDTIGKEVDTVEVTLPILKKGSKGNVVKTLQQLLNAKGYGCGTPDGSFGPNTDAALRKYQKAVSLAADGSCGKNTWTALLTK